MSLFETIKVNSVVPCYLFSRDVAAQERYPHVLQNTSAKLVASPSRFAKIYLAFCPPQLDCLLPVI